MGSVNTKVTLCGIEMDNPVIPASGTFGFGYEFAELYDINCLGTFSFKGTTKDPRFGNPTPRIAECYAGMINAVGLQNPGVEKVISEELPKLAKCFRKPVMANVSGFAIEDYAYTCGPEPMLKAVYKATVTDGQFSFEERMGCGFGACMGCSCKTVTGNKRICKEGPVLTKEDIIWEA